MSHVFSGCQKVPLNRSGLRTNGEGSMLKGIEFAEYVRSTLFEDDDTAVYSGIAATKRRN